MPWVEQWIDKVYPDAPGFGPGIQTRSFKLTWRFVTNGGQDDGVIRPVIGAKGWPFYPGSSMKGLFRRACTLAQAALYCGHTSGNDFVPGILRFHGGYPVDTGWTEGLVDIVHPQQSFQVKSDQREGGAFIQISLYKPTLEFGISSQISDSVDWEEVWGIWEKALTLGIGCRVSAGYGRVEEQKGEVIYQARLKGQGAASKLLDGGGEFRPNMFRAALRGHALRIFGGLCGADQADDLVDQLLGGIRRGHEHVGLLSMMFRTSSLELKDFGRDSYRVPTYNVQGVLSWILSGDLPEEQVDPTKKLVRDLMQFALLLGGFGKSWRRADHRKFYPDYYEPDQRKPLIGCQWEYQGNSLRLASKIHTPEQVGSFIEGLRQTAQDWIQLRGGQLQPNAPADWREIWHPWNVEVWVRIAVDRDDSRVIPWLHGPYRKAYPKARIFKEGSIYQSSLTGQMGQIGRLWHRMYPIVRMERDRENPDRPEPNVMRNYLEILTIFPDQAPETQEFLDYLEDHQEFTCVWPVLEQ